MAFDYQDYYELEYIESTGTQYLDTNYIPQTNDRIVADVYLKKNTSKNYEALYGSRLGTYQNNAWVFFQRFNGNTFNYNRTGAETNLSNSVYDQRITLTAHGNTATWTDGTNTYSGTTTGTPNNCVNSLFIFDINKASTAGGKTADGSNAYAKLYGFAIYTENDELSVDLIPAERKSDGVLGMYNTINGEFLVNKGSGTFLKGAYIGKPEDFYKLTYLQSSGTQYIDTGYVANANTKVVINDFKPLYAGQSWEEYFGCNTADDGGNSFEFRRNSSNSQVVFRVGSAQTSGVSVSSAESHKITLEYTGMTVDGTKYTIAGGNISTNTLYMFACHVNNGVFRQGYCAMGVVEIYENDTLIHNFVPAERIVDGRYGMYDTENDLFFVNNGTGTFGVGLYIPYTLTLSATQVGTVSGGGTKYAQPNGYSSFTISATADAGYTFVGWYSDQSYETLVSSDATYSLEINENTTLYAKFNLNYIITLVYDSALGTASYSWVGTQITLTATPTSIGQFVGWYINSVPISTSNPYNYTPTSDVTIEARFEEVFSITDSVVGNGALSYTRGADQNDVTFTVIPNANHHFVKYSVNGTDYTTTPLSIHLTQATSVIAYFEEDDRFTITASTTIEANSIYISANNVYAGTTVTLFARPYPAYNFVRWDDGNTDNPRTITVTANVTMVAVYLKEIESNSIYSYRCYIKDQMAMTDPPKAFLRVDSFNIKTDLMTTANSTITTLDTASNINNGDVLVLYDPTGTTLYQGVVKSMEDNKITCSQMQSFYKGTWIYNVYPSASLEEEIAYLLEQYAQGKMYRSSYTDPLVAQRLGGITIDYTASTSANLPTDLDSDGNENLTEMDMEKWIYDLYEDYSIVFDFEINYSGTNYVHIKVPSYSSIKVGNNMYAIKDMKPTTSIEETNRLIIFAQDKTYRTTYVATATNIVEEPSSTANRFDLTNTKIVYSDDPVADLIAANLPDQMYNHKLEFTLVVKNFIYQFGDFNLGGQLDIYYYDQYYNSVLTGYEIAKASNMNITDVKMVCGKVRSKLTQKLTLGRVQ